MTEPVGVSTTVTAGDEVQPDGYPGKYPPFFRGWRRGVAKRRPGNGGGKPDFPCGSMQNGADGKVGDLVSLVRRGPPNLFPPCDVLRLNRYSVFEYRSRDGRGG